MIFERIFTLAILLVINLNLSKVEKETLVLIRNLLENKYLIKQNRYLFCFSKLY